MSPSPSTHAPMVWAPSGLSVIFTFKGGKADAVDKVEWGIWPVRRKSHLCHPWAKIAQTKAGFGGYS